MPAIKTNNTYMRIDFHWAQDGVTENGFTHTFDTMKTELDKMYETMVFKTSDMR